MAALLPSTGCVSCQVIYKLFKCTKETKSDPSQVYTMLAFLSPSTCSSSVKGFCSVNYKQHGITYLLLTEFEGRTVSYGPSFFLLDGEKTRIRNLQYGPRKRG